jgi:hypothetical protein
MVILQFSALGWKRNAGRSFVCLALPDRQPAAGTTAEEGFMAQNPKSKTTKS